MMTTMRTEAMMQMRSPRSDYCLRMSWLYAAYCGSVASESSVVRVSGVSAKTAVETAMSVEYAAMRDRAYRVFAAVVAGSDAASAAVVAVVDGLY